MDNLVVGLGEVLWDILPEGKKLGGAPANFAYHVSQFGLCGCVVSAIGPDPLGAEITDIFNAKGLAHSLPVVPFPTGTVKVNLDSNGIPEYDITENVAWDHIPFTPDLERIARRARAVCFGSLAQRSPVSRDTIGRFLDAMPSGDDILKVFDINLRGHYYTKEILENSLIRCNILKINDEELRELGSMFDINSPDQREVCQAILEKYDLRILILTCGAVGSYVLTPEAWRFRQTPCVQVADTVGAGDSFTAAFVASLLKGKSVGEAHSLAVATSAHVCTCHGAMPALPPDITR